MGVDPRAMAVLGIFMMIIFFALRHSALEKYKARRKIPSVYPEYNCSPANVTVAFIFAVLLFALCFIFIKLELNAFWILCVTAIPLCVARTASLLPVTIIGRHAGVNQVLRLTISTIVPLALGSLVLLLPRDLYFSHKDILRVVLVLQWYFLVIWFGILGLDECLVQKYEREMAENGKTPRERAATLKTPKAWFRRNLPYYVLGLSALFGMLILAMSSPAFLIELIS